MKAVKTKVWFGPGIADAYHNAEEYFIGNKGAVETLTTGAGKKCASECNRADANRVGTTGTTIHAEMTPLVRIVDPTDIAEAALWLASDQSKFVEKTTLTLAGGL